VSNFLTGMQLALGVACVWIAVQFARQAARHWHDHEPRVNRLAHPEPVCLVRHEHKGRLLADHFRKAFPFVADADLAAMCAAFAAVTQIAARRHGSHAADVLLCDLDGAVRELQAAGQMEVPHE